MLLFWVASPARIAVAETFFINMLPCTVLLAVSFKLIVTVCRANVKLLDFMRHVEFTALGKPLETKTPIEGRQSFLSPPEAIQTVW